jgi:dTDP-glucose pyrophosphorylase
MGGLGSRFQQMGIKTPKPLIPIDGKPMFMRALQSFAPTNVARSIFVIRRDQDEEYHLGSRLREENPDVKIAVLDHDTRGPVETCLAARDLIDPSLPITVADCDIYFASEKYFETIDEVDQSDIEGILLTFDSSDPRYSYAEIDSQTKLVVRTAEKKVISHHALLGGYFFKRGQLFLDLADEFLQKGLNGLKEFYLSQLFNMIIASGGRVTTAGVDRMFIFGTPEELAAYRSLPDAERL